MLIISYTYLLNRLDLLIDTLDVLAYMYSILTYVYNTDIMCSYKNDEVQEVAIELSLTNFNCIHTI